MKKLLYSFLLTTAIINAQVTTFPWTETFETDSPTLRDWTQIYESGTQDWSILNENDHYYYNTGPYEGSHMAEFDGASFDGGRTKYISPILDLSSAINPTLEFYYRNVNWGADQNELNVYYRTSSTEDWILISNYNTPIADWASSGVLPLPSPSSTYQIAIEGVALYGRNINVDSLTVNTGVLSTSEVQLRPFEIKIFPNPVSSILNINSRDKITEISIHDVSGRMIKTEGISGNQVSVDYLKPGVYFITAKNTDGTSTTSKFIKK